MLFEASVRYFKEHDIKKLPSGKSLRGEIENLISKKNNSYNEYREAKAHEKETSRTGRCLSSRQEAA